jgi:glycosyltransferase involved in cell wall biosynthesis
MKIGIDLEQFVTDPFASGVQRVVQYLAKEWPESTPADWIVPLDTDYAILTSSQAAELISIPFDQPMHVSELPKAVAQAIESFDAPTLTEAELETGYDIWFLPEVCYTQKVLKRFERIQKTTTTAMIGYDTLPMSDPYNYKFTPGTLAIVSEYFRLIATTDILLCISEFTKNEVLTFLRRNTALTTKVIHPGGDHIPATIKPEHEASNEPITYLRVGTMETRKQPLEILDSFMQAVESQSINAELHFVGAPARVDVEINFAIERAIESGVPLRWTQNANDAQVMELLQQADVFLSFGREGYGIPVLESIQLGTPVFFDGTQPAAELMQGHGAHEIKIAQAFTAAVPEPISPTDQQHVPSWRSYSTSVAQALSTANTRGAQ